MDMTQNKFSTSGFTLIELLIVVAIIGLVSAMYLVSFNDPIKEASLDASYASVLTAIESARHKSVSGVGDSPFGVTVDGNTISTFRVGDEGQSIHKIVLPASVTTTSDFSTTTFQRISGQTGQSGELILTDTSGNTRTITITADGYVY